MTQAVIPHCRREQLGVGVGGSLVCVLPAGPTVRVPPWAQTTGPSLVTHSVARQHLRVPGRGVRSGLGGRGCGVTSRRDSQKVPERQRGGAAGPDCPEQAQFTTRSNMLSVLKPNYFNGGRTAAEIAQNRGSRMSSGFGFCVPVLKLQSCVSLCDLFWYLFRGHS